MADWVLRLFESPLNTTTGTGQITDLSLARNVKMQYSLINPHHLTFELPGRHWATYEVVPMMRDVIAFRNDAPMMRFRVFDSTRAKDANGEIVTQFDCGSYRELIQAWMVHEQPGFPPGSWTGHQAFVDTEQIDIAWALLNDAQTFDAEHDINLTLGSPPAGYVDVVRDRVGKTDGLSNIIEPEYHEGKIVGEAVDQLSQVIDGFEYDIIPDPAAPLTGLTFVYWNIYQRMQHTGDTSDFVLDDGGNVATWREVQQASEYGNVIFVQGALPAAFDDGTQPPAESAWYPVDEHPETPAPEGAWERGFSDDVVTEEFLAKRAQKFYADMISLGPTYDVGLSQGRWNPEDLWIGDYAKLLIAPGVIDSYGRVMYDDDGFPLVNGDVNAVVRVYDVNIDIDDAGSENVTLTLDRPKRTYSRWRKQLEQRLTAIERKRRNT